MGIQLADHSRILDQAVEIFTKMGSPLATQSEVEKISSEMDGIDDRKLYLVLDQRELLLNSAHYLIHGSERIFSIAAELRRLRGWDFQQRLKSIGTPTIFAVNLPLEVAKSSSDYQYLGNQILKSIPDDEVEKGPDVVPFAFTLRSPVLPSWVISHQNPNDLPDPHNGYQIYRWHPPAAS
jgi:hypothetical protein